METDLAAIQRRCERAMQIVHELSHEGRQWTMSIPADETNDPDVVLRAALRDLHALIAETARLMGVAGAAERLATVDPSNGSEFRKTLEQVRAALRTWKEA